MATKMTAINSDIRHWPRVTTHHPKGYHRSDDFLINFRTLYGIGLLSKPSSNNVGGRLPPTLPPSLAREAQARALPSLSRGLEPTNLLTERLNNMSGRTFGDQCDIPLIVKQSFEDVPSWYTEGVFQFEDGVSMFPVTSPTLVSHEGTRLLSDQGEHAQDSFSPAKMVNTVDYPIDNSQFLSTTGEGLIDLHLDSRSREADDGQSPCSSLDNLGPFTPHVFDGYHPCLSTAHDQIPIPFALRTNGPAVDVPTCEIVGTIHSTRDGRICSADTTSPSQPNWSSNSTLSNWIAGAPASAPAITRRATTISKGGDDMTTSGAPSEPIARFRLDAKENNGQETPTLVQSTSCELDAVIGNIADGGAGRKNDPEKTNKSKIRRDDRLLELRRVGVPYKKIKRMCGFAEAESTLRGRVRNLSKDKSQRVRKPKWVAADVSALSSHCTGCVYSTEGRYEKIISNSTKVTLLHKAMNHHVPFLSIDKARPRMEPKSKVPWKAISNWMKENGASYPFAPVTCSKKWEEIVGV